VSRLCQVGSLGRACLTSPAKRVVHHGSRGAASP
jgi:hypothetical protein